MSEVSTHAHSLSLSLALSASLSLSLYACLPVCVSPCQPASQPACLLTVWRLCLCLTHTHTRRHVVEAMSAGRFHSFVRAQHQKHPSCKQSMAGIDRLGCRCSKLNALGLCAARCAHPMLLRFGSEKPEAPAVPSFGLRALRQFSSEPNPYEAMNPDPETLNLNHPARTVVSFCLEGSPMYNRPAKGPKVPTRTAHVYNQHKEM